jgi:hypothetical protein
MKTKAIPLVLLAAVALLSQSADSQADKISPATKCAETLKQTNEQAEDEIGSAIAASITLVDRLCVSARKSQKFL